MANIPLLTEAELQSAKIDPVTGELYFTQADGTRITAGVVSGATDAQTAGFVGDPNSLTNAQLSATIDEAMPGTSGGALIGYGPSYMVGTRASSPDKQFFNIVAAGGAFASSSNRSVSGSTSVENFYDANTGLRVTGWTPLTDGGIVLIEPVVNSAQIFGPALKGYAATLNSVRALVALVRARAKHEHTDAHFNFSGTWASQSASVNSGGSANYTTAADAYCEYHFVGSEATVIVQAKDTAAGGTAYGPIAVSVDGGPETTYTLGDQAISYTPGSSGSAFGATIVYAPFPVRVAGLQFGSHTIKIRNITSGNILMVDCAYLPESNPPAVALIQDTPRPDWSSSTAGGSNAVQDVYNAQLWQVADEFGGPITVVTPDPTWNTATDTDVATNDGKHPSDAGHAKYAARILARLRGLGVNPAWTAREPGDGFTGDHVAPGTILPGIPGDYVSRYVAEDLTGTDGSSVTTWTDRTAAVDIVGTTGPTLRTSPFRYLEFNGVDAALRRPRAAVAPTTRLIVCQIPVLTGSSQIVAAEDQTATQIIGKSSSGTWILNSGSVLDSGITADTAWVVLGAVFDGASSRLTVNGVATVEGSAGTNAGGANLMLAYYLGTKYAVNVAELVIYNRALSSSELRGAALQLVEDYAVS